ncbi:MAG: alpha-L-fucosidase [Ferruginibacter sp.]
MNKCFLLLYLSITGLCLHAQVKPLLPIPSASQLAWHDMEFYLFMHFGPNTFTDLEWGNGSEHEEVFDPSRLDCEQWCRIAKAAGAKGIIITAKHHDGFCLWPSKYSTHTVGQSKWKNGKGDVLKTLSNACKKYNLKFGVYLSPWDRNHPQYGTAAYNDVYINMMKEVVADYGPLFEFWWDGANGEGPNGKKQLYDWHRFESTLRSIAPNTPVFSDIGPDIRWVGNEQGFAATTNWNLLDTAGFSRGQGSPPTDTLTTGNIFGKNWIPAECDVSIRPGWFYHEKENAEVKTPKELFDLYLRSVGRGSSLLLNVPPDRNGLINENDSASLVNFRKTCDDNFRYNLADSAKIYYSDHNKLKPTNLLNDKNNRSFIATALKDSPNIIIRFSKLQHTNCIVLSEPLQMGQRIISFTVSLIKDNKPVKEIKATTIGHKRILTFAGADVQSIEIKINDAKSIPLMSEITVYNIQEGLVEKK